MFWFWEQNYSQNKKNDDFLLIFVEIPSPKKERKKLTRSKRNQLLLFQTRNLQNQKWIHLYQISLIWNQVLAFIKSPYVEYLKS